MFTETTKYFGIEEKLDQKAQKRDTQKTIRLKSTGKGSTLLDEILLNSVEEIERGR